MPYGVEFKQEAIDGLRHVDKAVAQRRVGSYRVIYEINRKERLLTVHLVGHRRDIYKRK